MTVKKHAKVLVSIGNWPYGRWSSCTDSVIPLPGLVAVVTLSLGVIGYDKNIASWCWIDPDTPAILFWQFFTGKAWEMSTYLLTIVMYSVVRGFLFKHVSWRLGTCCKWPCSLVTRDWAWPSIVYCPLCSDYEFRKYSFPYPFVLRYRNNTSTWRYIFYS